MASQKCDSFVKKTTDKTANSIATTVTVSNKCKMMSWFDWRVKNTCNYPQLS